ncbi:Uncharacterised protein [Bordetella pertussis]|nr:Uncharacterised protein [Bordetella pertussis]
MLTNGKSSSRFFRASILLTTRMLRRDLGSRGSSLASPSDHLPASTTCTTTSTSASACVTTRFIMRFMAPPWRVWKPGVSTNTNCSCSRVSTPWMRWRVVWALRDTIDILVPISALVRVDLPTLGRPTMATKPARNCGLLI